MGHGFGDHFSRFVAGDAAMALEILTIDAWMMPASASSTTDW